GYSGPIIQSQQQSLTAPTATTTVVVNHCHHHALDECSLVVCNHCGNTVLPRVKKSIGNCTILTFFGLLFTVPACAWIPFICGSTKDSIFVCPICRSRLAVYKRGIFF